MSPFGIHSLLALQNKGDSLISKPIEYEFLRVFPYYTGTTGLGSFHNPDLKSVGWIGNDGTTVRVLVYNYAQDKWSNWSPPMSSVTNHGTVVNFDGTPAKYKLFMGGSKAGRIYYSDRSLYSDQVDGAAAVAIAFSAVAPQSYTLNNKPPQQEVQFERLSVFAQDAHQIPDISGGTDTDGTSFSLTLAASSSTTINVGESTVTVREAPRGIKGIEYAKTTLEGRDTWIQPTFSLSSTTVRPQITGYTIDFTPAEALASETA